MSDRRDGAGKDTPDQNLVTYADCYLLFVVVSCIHLWWPDADCSMPKFVSARRSRTSYSPAMLAAFGTKMSWKQLLHRFGGLGRHAFSRST